MLIQKNYKYKFEFVAHEKNWILFSTARNVLKKGNQSYKKPNNNIKGIQLEAIHSMFSKAFHILYLKIVCLCDWRGKGMAMEVEKNETGFKYWFPSRRRFFPDSPFFASGNVERELLAKQVYYISFRNILFIYPDYGYNYLFYARL